MCRRLDSALSHGSALSQCHAVELLTITGEPAICYTHLPLPGRASKGPPLFGAGSLLLNDFQKRLAKKDALVRIAISTVLSLCSHARGIHLIDPGCRCMSDAHHVLCDQERKVPPTDL